MHRNRLPQILVLAAALSAAAPALAGIGESGLWDISDRTVTQVDPSSAIGQLMKKAGKSGMPDKIQSFQQCLSPKMGDFLWTIPKKDAPLDSKLPDCTIKNRRQTDTFLAFDLECKSLHAHREVTWLDKHHVVETLKSDLGIGMTTMLTRTATWQKPDCGAVEPFAK